MTLIRVAMTHRVFSGTNDEPAHITAGYDWWSGLPYTVDEHTPLARILCGLPVRIEGSTPPPPAAGWVVRGAALLGDASVYPTRLQHARMGNLPLLALGVWAVWSWSRRRFSDRVALIAAALFAVLPPVLAHAGLVTTDMAITATLPLALDALTRWLDAPSWRTEAWLGVTIGLGLIAKYSFVAFFPPAAILVAIAHRQGPIRRIALTVAIAFVVVWAAYRFDFGTINNAYPPVGEAVHPRWLSTLPIPAPRFVAGAFMVKFHSSEGHWSYLLGEIRRDGWWYYFPVALLVKTPLPFLALWLLGTAMLIRRRGTIDLALIPFAILAIAMTTKINLGVRHIMPMYAPMAICAAVAVDALWQRSREHKLAAGILVAWLAIGTTIAHPDYLPWFNELAGRHPERILDDSNLDWGQDLYRLARVTRAEHVHDLGDALFHSSTADQVGLPSTHKVSATKPSSGWIAISDTIWQSQGGPNVAYAWVRPRATVERRIGKSIHLFYIP